MEIIPVIDLLDGQVVHAKRGERQHYQPIRSQLCASSDPIAIVSALLELYAFKSLYIADLGAIQKRGDHRSIIRQISTRFPDIKLWLDAGISTTDELASWHTDHIQWVIGSESLSNLSEYLALRETLKTSFILSLDHRQYLYIGPLELLQRPDLWPETVIAMTLSNVGSRLGPDLNILQQLSRLRSDIRLYAAGGIRGLEDIKHLDQAGIAGALVATALHEARFLASDLISLNKKTA